MSQSVKTSLSRQGYSIYKSTLSEIEIKKIRDELTVSPYIYNSKPEDRVSFQVYIENADKIYVPKMWGIAKYGMPQTNKISYNKIDVAFNGAIRPQQDTLINEFLKIIGNGGCSGGIITLKCGGGKTVTALNIISRIQVKTLIVVHKDFLLNQWCERIKQFLPTARVGFIKGQTVDVADKDIVIGMLQSISMKSYDNANVFHDFGLSIYDECHHLGAEVFSRALFKTTCPISLGLSATPDRMDGLTKVFKWHIGDFIRDATSANAAKDTEVDVELYYVVSPELSHYNRHIETYQQRILTPQMINNITTFDARNQLICDYILPRILAPITPASAPTCSRCILILSDRKAQLLLFKEAIKKQFNIDAGMYVGGMKIRDLQKSEQSSIILGTFAMISEGFDCKRLNTLILATPRRDVEQSVGRILRQQSHERTVKPLVIDIIDTFSIFDKQAHKRLQLYEHQGYSITGYTFNITAPAIIALSAYHAHPPATTIYNARKNPKSKKSRASTNKHISDSPLIIPAFID